MLVLEACGSLVLYTGVTRVGLPVRDLSETCQMRVFHPRLSSLLLSRSARCLSPASCHPALSSPTTFPSSARRWIMLARRPTLGAGTSRGWMMWGPIVLVCIFVSYLLLMWSARPALLTVNYVLVPCCRLSCPLLWSSWEIQTLNAMKSHFWRTMLSSRPRPPSVHCGILCATGSLWYVCVGARVK